MMEGRDHLGDGPVAVQALRKADLAYQKWENHEALCAERYKRLDHNVTTMVRLSIGTLLTMCGSLALVVINLALKNLS